jgi:hypothetical protein
MRRTRSKSITGEAIVELRTGVGEIDGFGRLLVLTPELVSLEVD